MDPLHPITPTQPTIPPVSPAPPVRRVDPDRRQDPEGRQGRRRERRASGEESQPTGAAPDGGDEPPHVDITV